MKKPDRVKFVAAMGMAAALVFYAGTGAWAQLDTDLPGGHLKIQTALETEWGIHTAGRGNRNNDNNHTPGSGQGFSTDGNDVQAAVGRVDTLTTFRGSDDLASALWLDNADVYLHLRFLGDAANLINGPSAYEFGRGAYHTPGQGRYPGDAWSAYISEHEYEADANEAYIDLRKGPVALRLGKQQVVYGEELGVQTLDQVDSLNFASVPGFFDIASLEYSDIRIAEWTAKLSYQLPDFSDVGIDNSIITGFVSPDFQPDYLYGLGQQLNDEPAAEPIGDYGNLRKARNKLVYGAVAATTVYGVDLTANFYATPDHVGWFTVAPVANPFPKDPFAGQLFLGPAAGPVDFLFQRRFSRDFIYGGSASYTVPHLDFLGADVLNGDIFHFSAAYTPHKTFWTASSIVNSAIKPTRIGEINWTLDGERYIRWSQKFPSMYLLGEWNYKSRSTVISDIYEPTIGHKGIQTVVLSLTQFFPNNIWGAGIVALCDTNVGGNWLMQPSITYKPTSNQEYNVFWNFDEGTQFKTGVGHTSPLAGTGSKLGAYSWLDAIYFRAIYKM